MKKARDLRLDFCRGIALLIIFIDHIPHNPLTGVTLRKFAFCDAAEVFVLISGIATYLAYGSKLEREGGVGMAHAVARRWMRVYLAHLLLFASIVSLAYVILPYLSADNYVHHLKLERLFASPVGAIFAAATLRYLPTYLDILPLYLLLLAAAPLALMMIRRSPLITLGISAAIYFGARATGFNLDNGCNQDGWVFNPLAWQFLYVIGMVIGFWSRRGGEKILTRTGLIAALTFCAFGVIAAAPWLGPDAGLALPISSFKLWPAEKTFLSPLRLLNVLALTYLFVYFVRAEAGFFKSRVAKLFVWSGQHSLAVYSVGVFLSCAAYVAISETSGSLAVCMAMNIVGAVILLGLGSVLHSSGAKEPSSSIAVSDTQARVARRWALLRS